MSDSKMRAWRIAIEPTGHWEVIVPARSKSAAIRRAIASVREAEGLHDLGLKGHVLREGS